MFWLAERIRPRLEARFQPVPAGAEPAAARVEPDLVAPAPAEAAPAVPPEEEDEHATALDGHTILAGYGRVGTVIGEGLIAAGMPFVLIEDAERPRRRRPARRHRGHRRQRRDAARARHSPTSTAPRP